jgi:hypothetical protein
VGFFIYFGCALHWIFIVAFVVFYKDDLLQMPI